MKKTQAILKKLNIVASSLEEMSFLQESNEIHKVFIKIVSNHNTRLAQGQNIIDEALDPVVQREQDSIKEKQPPLGYHEANKRILFFILSESGDFQFLKAKLDNFMKTLNLNPADIDKLTERAIFYIKLKASDPSLDLNLYIKANNALTDAMQSAAANGVVNTYNIGKINNYLRKQVKNRDIQPKEYLTALEMSRLRSTGQKPPEA